MKLSDLLMDGWIVAPLEAADLEGALRAGLAPAQESAGEDQGWAERLSTALSEGEDGEVVRINDEVVVAIGASDAFATPTMGVAVSATPFRVSKADGQTAPQGARVLFSLLTPGRIAGTRAQVVPALARVLTDDSVMETLLSVGGGAGFGRVREVLAVDFRSPTLVSDVVEPVGYRVYPDTPLTEVMDLMVRRGVHAVPVVGEQYEVLGILTSGDALGHLLRRGRPGDRREGRTAAGPDPVARDFMTRTVMCVSEDQALTEAVNWDVEQLPVVREGELIGFVTRDSILGALYGALESDNKDNTEGDSNS
jgi:CBS domain-containing protein